MAINEQASVDYYNKQPGIRMGGGVLIFNEGGELLLVKPSYRNTWAWPGGGSDPGESPRAVALRECKEEIGLCPEPLYPAFVNYIPPQEDGSLDKLQFAFRTDPVPSEFIREVRPQPNEIEAIRFVPVTALGNYMKEYRVRAVQTYLDFYDGNDMLYMEDGVLA